MPAEKAPRPADNSNDLIGKFRADYGIVLQEARVSAEHTATFGWQGLYAARKRKDRDSRRNLAESLKAKAELLETVGWSEDDEKAVKDIAKSSLEMREAETVFERTVVDRVAQPVFECDRIRREYRNRAANEERSAPLHNVGLEALTEAEIARQPTPIFNRETGVVEIKEPSAQ